MFPVEFTITFSIVIWSSEHENEPIKPKCDETFVANHHERSWHAHGWTAWVGLRLIFRWRIRCHGEFYSGSDLRIRYRCDIRQAMASSSKSQSRSFAVRMDESVQDEYNLLLRRSVNHVSRPLGELFRYPLRDDP